MYALAQHGDFVIRTMDGAFIPMDENNRDYLDYLEWVGLGNEPDPAPGQSADEISAAIDQERDRRMHTRFAFDGVWYQCRPQDVTNITGAGATALASVVAGATWPADFVWIAEDNSRVPMRAEEVIALGNAYTAFRSALIFRASDMKTRVRDGETVDYLRDEAWGMEPIASSQSHPIAD